MSENQPSEINGEGHAKRKRLKHDYCGITERQLRKAFHLYEVREACDRFFDSRGMPRNEMNGQSFGGIGLKKKK